MANASAADEGALSGGENASEVIRLTQFSHGAGCGCKVAPDALASIMSGLDMPRPEALIVGTASGDDAAVWRLDADRALVATTDFFTPVVDDPRTWGQIAAANAVSDVYAMGATPLFALNLVAWNVAGLPASMLTDVLAGGQDIAARAGFAIVGGHTIDDPEPKYGLAVIGTVHPDRVLTNAGLRAGQDIILTKPLGVGILTTAVKQGVATPQQAEAAAATMTRLNDDASAIAVAAGVTGCTDVTGFGLAGHLGRMAMESTVSVVIEVDALPVLPGARDLAAAGVVPGGTRRNLEWAARFLDPGDRDDIDRLIVADAQTSGGLVFGVDPAATDTVLSRLADTGHSAARIGRAVDGPPGLRLR